MKKNNFLGDYMLKLELLDNKIFKEAFDSISKIVDEVVCDVDSEGFHVTAIDRSHVCFVELNLEPSVFEEFECSKPERLCIDTQEFMRVLKRAKKNDVLRLNCDEGNLIIGFIGDVDRTFKIRLIDMDYENPKAPNINVPCGVNVDSGLIKDAIGDMELFSDQVYFLIDEEYFIVNCDGEFGDASFKYLHGETGVNEKVKSSFSIGKLKDIFTASKFSDIVNINLGNNMPMIVDFELVTGDGDLKFLLAPRIEVEDEYE